MERSQGVVSFSWPKRQSGEVAEWSKANDSKSFEGKPSVGSNPTLSVPIKADDDKKAGLDGALTDHRQTSEWFADPSNQSISFA